MTMRILTLLIPLLLMSCDGSAFASFAKDDLYRSGQKAIDEGRWNEATSIFGKVAEQGGPEADAGLYWKAYAQHKAGNRAEALATIRKLAATFPKSAWLDDARALEVEMRGDQGQPVRPSAEEDEELKLYALSGLMNHNPQKALPLVQQYLNGKHSQEDKEKALFLLTQSDLPQARQALLQIVRGSAHPELRAQAIQYVGIVGEEDRALLGELDGIYSSSQDRKVRSAVIEAFGIAEHRAGLVALIRSEKDRGLRQQAIDMLSGADGAAELRSLLQSESDPETRRSLIRALGNTGDLEVLINAARNEKDPETRVEAIHSLGNDESPKAMEALRSIYSASADRRTRTAVIDALTNQENAKALIEIFRAEKDRELRKEIVHRLADMDSPEAEAFVTKIFEQE
ncbi:MAG TPA: HEAT repeat domain-containing protein [Thermoanaerobaculia bacterium]|jgi:HEAT repeat protein|nr:HEAT repeat domain-containing protein [Thermoanaerobaculia bacterium]